MTRTDPTKRERLRQFRGKAIKHGQNPTVARRNDPVLRDSDRDITIGHNF
jgi:hypothetical protein